MHNTKKTLCLSSATPLCKNIKEHQQVILFASQQPFSPQRLHSQGDSKPQSGTGGSSMSWEPTSPVGCYEWCKVRVGVQDTETVEGLPWFRKDPIKVF